MPRATYGNLARVRQQNLQAEFLDRIEEAKQATAAAAFLNQPMLELREKIVNRLVSMYRAGNTSHDALVGAIAELAALDFLTKHIENAQRLGEIAAEKEFGNG